MTNPGIIRILSFVTLLAWSGALLYFYISGRIVSYLHPSFRLNVLLAGVVLLVLAVLYWIFGKNATDCCDHDHGDHDHTHDHDDTKLSVGKILTFAILLVPMLTAAKFSPGQFGLTALQNRLVVEDVSSLRGARTGATVGGGLNTDVFPLPQEGDVEEVWNAGTTGSVEDYIERTEEGYLKVEVVDLMFGTEDEVLRNDFEGKMVEVIGQVMPADQNNPTGSRFRLARMFMWCCAGDARPIVAYVEPGDQVVPGDAEWIRVVGRPQFPVEGGKRIPLLQAEQIFPSSSPEEPILY